MRFVLGLIFGVAVTFSAAWYWTSAQHVSPIEQSVGQPAPADTELPVAEATELDTDNSEQLTVRDDLPPPLERQPVEPELAQTAWTDPIEQLELAQATEPAEQPTQKSEPVWTVFHSEASASGFADYLSQSINHPFEVTKLGPAQYQVSYSYTSLEQAEMVTKKIKMITGTQ